MKLIKYFLIFSILCTSITVAQELTKEEKRAKRKQIRLYLKKSRSYFDAQQVDSAYIYIDSLLLFDSKNVDGFYYKGLIELKKNDTTKADSTLTQGVALAPLSTRIKILLARIKIEKKDYIQASELLDAILRIKPNEAETLYLRGLTYLYQNDTTNALEYLQNGLETALNKGN